MTQKYLARTNNGRWGIGESESEALTNAEYTATDGKVIAQVTLLTEQPQDLRIDGWGDVYWSNVTCEVIDNYLVIKGKRESLESMGISEVATDS